MKNLLVGLGFFLAVVVVGFYLVRGASFVKNPNLSQNASQTSSIESSALPSGKFKEFNISAKEYAFTPSIVTVQKGDGVKVNFTNDGTVPHNFTITQLNVATKTINSGESVSVTFVAENAGTYTYHCSIDGHRDFGMQGTLIVN